MNAQGVPFGGLPWEAPTTRLGRFLPALRDDFISGRLRASPGRVGQPHPLLVSRGGVVLLVLLGRIPLWGG